jgi:hypothetical protein
MLQTTAAMPTKNKFLFFFPKPFQPHIYALVDISKLEIETKSATDNIPNVPM